MPVRRTLLALAVVFTFVFSLAMRAQAADVRVVALIPSLAEDAFAIGAHVIAVSKFTDDLAPARDLPRVADSQSIDVERIVALHPDVVVGIPSQARLTEPLRRAGMRVVLIADDSYDDIFTDIRTLGSLTGRTQAASALVLSLQRETAHLHALTRSFAHRPSVFFALGTGPVWTVGPQSFLGRMIELAGGRNVASDLRQPWGEYSEEALLRAQPDAIVAGPETQLRDVLGTQPWRSLRAVRRGHVFIATNPRVNAALFRPGPRYNEGLRWLIDRLSSLSTPTT